MRLVFIVLMLNWLALCSPASSIAFAADKPPRAPTICTQDSVDLSIRLNAPEAPRLYTRMRYEIVVSNGGPATATGVVVTNQVPPELAELAIGATQGTWTLSNQFLRCELGTLPAGGSGTVLIETIPRGNDSYHRTGWVSLETGVSSLEPDRESGNNFASARMRIGGPDLAVLLQPPTNQVRAAVPFQVIVTVTNMGPGDVEDVVLYHSGSVTQACPVCGARYWPDLLAIGYSLSQGEVAEILDGGMPSQVNLGTIAASASATMILTLVPTRTGELGFSSSVRSFAIDPDDNDSEGVPILVDDGPGIIQFTVARQNVREDEGAIAVEIQRLHGTAGTISIQLASEDESAIAGQDYVSMTSTVVFDEGDSAKTVMVTILDNARANCNATFTLRLGQPAGGAILWGQTNVSITIIDDDVVPSGSLQAVGIPVNGLATGYGATAFSSLSADGRWLAFASLVRDLVPGDTNQTSDVFLKDLQTGEISLVSVSRFGNCSANGFSSLPLISADGRQIAFVSYATDLVTNALPQYLGPGQVFVRNVAGGTTRLVSVNPAGTGADWGTSLNGFYTLMGISSNGQMVAFRNDGRTLAGSNVLNRAQLFVRNILTEETLLVTMSADATSVANEETYEVSLSGNGRFIAFDSSATNLVAGFGRRGYTQVYVRDLVEGRTTPVSVRYQDQSAGFNSFSPMITPDGKFIVFGSVDGDLAANDESGAGIFIRDVVNGITRRASIGISGFPTSPSVSANGRLVAFRNGKVGASSDPSSQIYVNDVWSNSTSLVSVNCRGTGPGNAACINPTISADGRYVFFQSIATDLVAGGFDDLPLSRETGLNVFRRDLLAGVTVLITQNRDLSRGTFWNSGLATPFGQFNIAADGNVAIVVAADDLVYEDANGFIDLFVWRAGGIRDGQPHLTISIENSEVLVRWPPGATNFALQLSESINDPVWTNVAGDGITNLFRVDQRDEGFFRLKKSAYP